MNPQRDYTSFDTVTTRAFITLFRRVGDEFQFAVDSRVNDDEEVRAYLHNSHDADGKTVIGVTAINEKERFDTIVSAAEDLGLTVDTDSSVNEHESIGEYTAYVADAYAPDSLDAEWNVPHLLVYGSLSPEIEEVCAEVFGHRDDISVENIRNHFVVFGEGVTEDTRTELATAVQNSDSFFRDHQEDVVSDIHVASLI